MTGQPRSTQRSSPRERGSTLDAEITKLLRSFALANPRQGYRKAHRAVLAAGYRVNLKRVHRLWREAGLKVPMRKRKNKRAGYGVKMGAHHPIRPNITWAFAFQFDTTVDGKVLKLLNVIDEYSREYVASLVDRSIDAKGVIAALDGIVAEHGVPAYIRMDNGPEFISHALASWAREMGVTLYFIDPGSPWQNGKCESLNSRIRDELLNGELFTSVTEARFLTQHYRETYNATRAHSSLGYLSPEEFLALRLSDQRTILTQSSKHRNFYAANYSAPAAA